MRLGKFERSLAIFRKHVADMRALGYQHVSVKFDGQEFHVEGTTGPAEHIGGSVAPSGEDDYDALGRPSR